MKIFFEMDTICRLCLRADEKVYKLKNTDQKVFIESIIKLKQDNYVPTDDLYICYICSALLTKSFNFMKTIWSAQKVVCAILKNTNMITKRLLYCIDRHNTGLNPITLSRVVTFFDNVKFESSDNTSSDSKTIADIVEVNLDLLIKKEKPRKQKDPNMNKINYHSKSQNKLIISDDDESDKCNLDEIKVEMCNNFEIEFTKAESSDPLTKELNTDEPIPETKKAVIKKNRDIEKSPSNENKLIISISDENEESDKCNLDEMKVEMCNNFEIEFTKAESSDPLTKELNTDEPIPETKKAVIKKNRDIEKNPSNENKLIISISNEDEESDKCNLDEMKVEMCNNFEIEFIKAEISDPLTKELNTDEPIPETKKPVIKKYRDLEKSPSNENNLIISISDEDEESDKCNVDEMEVEICNNFEIGGIQTESSDPLTKELNTDACNEPIPKTKRTVRKKNAGLKKKTKIHLESEDSSSSEKKRKYEKKEIDYDYQPDSTSHSEDSDYDSYDDEGKTIKRPKDDRVYPMKCDHCDFEVLEKRNHYRHYLISHPNIEYPYKHEKEYACSICGILCTKARIGIHEDNHTTQELKCYFCPKVFSNKTRRQKHVLKVHPRRTFTCDYCSKTFKTKSDLTRHLRTHTGSKPFKCHICGDGFAHSGNRSVHIRSKHQNYKCAKRVRRNKTDTEISTYSEETVRKTKTIRRSNNQSENTGVTLKNKRKTTKQRSKNKGVGGADTAMVSEDGNQHNTKEKEIQLVSDMNVEQGCKNKEVGGADTAMVSEDGNQHNTKEKEIQIVSDMNIEQGCKNYQNAEIESEDEILAMIKRSFF